MSRADFIDSSSGPSDRRNSGERTDRLRNLRPHRTRVFFALWPRPALSRRLHELARAVQAVSGGRVMRCETLHQTLAFVGDIPRERIPALIAAGRALRFDTFGFELDFVRRWSRNRIIWAGASAPPSALTALALTLVRDSTDAGFRRETRDFVPHVTLVRDSEREAGFDMIEPLVWEVDEFVLVESVRDERGASYRLIERFASVNRSAGP